MTTAGFGLQPFGTSYFGGAFVPPAPVVDDRQYDLLRGSHFAYGYVEAWQGGVVQQVEVDGRLTTRLPLVSGSVEVDGSTPGARRVLSASFAPIPGLFDLLAPVGTELRAFLVVRGPDGVEQVTAQGVFDIDVQRMGYAASGDVQVTAPDRWARVQRGRFIKPRASSRGVLVRTQIASLLTEVMPAGVSVVDVSTSPAVVPAQVWDRDRDKAVEALATAAGLDVFMDRSGVPTIRDAPVLSGESVAWTVDAGDLGVLVSADRERNRQRTFNVVVASGDPNDGGKPFEPQVVWDRAPNSPTYAGPDPVNRPQDAGPFGVRPTFYSSPLLVNAMQALAAAQVILSRVQGLAAQLELTTVTKPDLDDGDTILVKLPPEYRGAPAPLELHLVDRMSVSLVPSRTPMTISTRSTAVGYEGTE